MWLACFLSLILSVQAPERVRLFLELQDPYGAELALAQVPETHPEHLELKLKTLSSFPSRDRNKKLLREIKNSTVNPQSISQSTLEAICWSTIKSGALSPLPQIRLESAIAAAQSNLSEGILLLNDLSRDNHTGIRRVAFTLGAQLPDQILTNRAIEALTFEPSFEVRLSALNLLSARKSHVSEVALQKHLKKEHLHPEERYATVYALRENSPTDLIPQLAESNHPLDKILCCQLIDVRTPQSFVDKIIPLLNDKNEEVAIQAFYVLGVRVQNSPPIEERRDASCIYKASKNWFLERTGKEGLSGLKAQLASPLRSERLIAISRLIALNHSHLDHTDPLVRLNSLKSQITWGNYQYCAPFLELLSQTEGLLSEVSDGPFSYLNINENNHTPLVPHYPESVDLLTRLELIALVARTQTIDTRPYLKQFLKQKSFGVAAEAAFFMTTEFEHEGLEVVESLCMDPDQTIRVQAALLLSLLLHEERALNILISEYPTCTTEMKAVILASIGSIGTKKAIPFLFSALQEDLEALRIRASWAILSSLSG